MGSYDFVTADEFGKMVGPFLAPLLRIWLFFTLFWTIFGPLAKSRSVNPVQHRSLVRVQPLQLQLSF